MWWYESWICSLVLLVRGSMLEADLANPLCIGEKDVVPCMHTFARESPKATSAQGGGRIDDISYHLGEFAELFASNIFSLGNCYSVKARVRQDSTAEYADLLDYSSPSQSASRIDELKQKWSPNPSRPSTGRKTLTVEEVSLRASFPSPSLPRPPKKRNNGENMHITTSRSN